jgi:MinD-like ATPase involved in chromosome partitioning or flagellar assembly
MSTTEVLVTVVGTARRGDVCLDDSVPISALLPDLSRHYGGPAVDAELVLATDPAAVLNPDASLRDAGVTHGTRLMIRARPPQTNGVARVEVPAGDGAPQPQIVVPTPPPAGAVNPIERTRATLPERHGAGRRFRRSLAAASGKVMPSGPPALPPTRMTPSPAELTLPDAPGPVARWKRAWEDTDYLHRLDLAITRPQLTRCATIAIVSPKGGVGKTTTTALLGTLIAHLRRDLVLAVDANPDYGSLGRVLCPNHTFFVDDLSSYFASAGAAAPSMADLNARLGSGPHGLRVLPAPTDPDRMSHIGCDTYRDIIGRLRDYAGVLLVDCGTGLHEPAARAALDAADQVIVVSDADPATASLVAEAIRRIPVAAPLTLVVNKMPVHGARLDLNRLAETLPGVDYVVVIPTEPKAASTLGVGAFCWDGVPLPWQRSVRELAAVLIAGWASLGLERRERFPEAIHLPDTVL